MKLFAASRTSPFACRVRLAVYARGLDIEICPVPNDDTQGPEYLAINPLGRIPALILDDGMVIVESEVIMEYLEDRFAQSSLRPASVEDRARARMIARVADLYVFETGRALVAHLNPQDRDDSVVEATFAALDDQLAHLESFLGAGPYAVGAELSTADCALATTLAGIQAVSVHFGRPTFLARHPKIAAYLGFIPSNPHVARIFGEMREAYVTRLGPS